MLDEVRSVATAVNLSDDATIDLTLAAAEALNNIIIHGYESRADEVVKISISGLQTGVEIVLTDTGRVIPSAVLEASQAFSDPASMMDESGRGFAIIKMCVQNWSYSSVDGVNRLTLVRGDQGAA